MKRPAMGISHCTFPRIDMIKFGKSWSKDLAICFVHFYRTCRINLRYYWSGHDARDLKPFRLSRRTDPYCMGWGCFTNSQIVFFITVCSVHRRLTDTEMKKTGRTHSSVPISRDLNIELPKSNHEGQVFSWTLSLSAAHSPDVRLIDSEYYPKGNSPVISFSWGKSNSWSPKAACQDAFPTV